MLRESRTLIFLLTLCAKTNFLHAIYILGLIIGIFYAIFFSQEKFYNILYSEY